ncbi:hypothetical protein CE91St57_50740 [Lachnospiraceae bacterium]|nr:hypothetical protein CE91St57_50740 [Lachnospiraceae bacterium]
MVNSKYMKTVLYLPGKGRVRKEKEDEKEVVAYVAGSCNGGFCGWMRVGKDNKYGSGGKQYS